MCLYPLDKWLYGTISLLIKPIFVVFSSALAEIQEKRHILWLFINQKKEFCMKKIFLILIIGLAFFACKDEQPDPEKAQNSPNVPMFANKTATITTNDTFTDKRWNNIVTAIVGKFSTAYNAGNENVKNSYAVIFDFNITITVEKNPIGYTNYKVIGTEHKLSVRANGVDNLDTIQVVMAMTNNETVIDGVTQ
jgi:hypothetical protein